MEEYLGFEEVSTDTKIVSLSDNTDYVPKKRPLSSFLSTASNKKHKVPVKQVSVSSLLSTSSPWLELAAHSFLPPHYPISEQRVAYWKYYSQLPPIIQLHEEMLAFEKYISPTPSEIAARKDVLMRIDNIVQELWPGSKVSSFGSFFTQLYLPTSDIDIVVIGNSGKSGLRKLASSLVKHKLVDNNSIKVISRARIPIIKFTEKRTKFVIDISFNQESGIDGSEKLCVLLSKWPGIRPLVLALKQFLLNRGLNEVYSGGLGSYGLILMCISFFQMHPMIQTQLINPEENLGVLLIEFFELYGKCFYYDRVGISVLGKGSYYCKNEKLLKLSNLNIATNHLLSIEDPYDVSNDVTKASFSISAVRQAFGYAYEILTALIAERLKEGHSSRHQNTGKGKEKNNLKSICPLPSSMLSALISIPDTVIQHRFQIENEYK